MHSNPVSKYDQKPEFRRNNLELLQDVFENAPIPVCILGEPDHVLSYLNKESIQLLGNYSFSIGKPVKDVMYEMGKDKSVIDKHIELLNRIALTGEPVKVDEYKLNLNRAGIERKGDTYIQVVYYPVSDINGEVYAIFIAGLDVTDHIKAKQDVLDNEQRLALALKGARLGFWEFNVRNSTLEFTSDQLKAHYGFPPDKVFKYEDFIAAIHPDDRDHVKNKIQAGLEESGYYEVEYRVFWPDGSQHWLMGRGQWLCDGQGRPYRRIGIAMDITTQKEAENKLLEAVQLRDEFLSIASHELQTPVTSLKARTELFERQLRDSGDGTNAQQASKINSYIEQLSQLTGNLLDISRLQENKLRLEMETFSISELLKEVIEIIEHTSHHNVEIHSKRDYHVYADRYRISQVFVNILQNAIKYSPEADRIVVHIIERKGKLTVSVVDFGIGVTQQDKGKIFRRFFKGTGSNKKTYPGFGIGLYVAAQILQRHGRRIWVEDNPGGGAIFRFTLTATDGQ